MPRGRGDHLFDVTSRRENTSSARADRGILRIVVCIGVALLQSALVRAQEAVPTIPPEPTILPELSKRTGPGPMKAQGTPIPDTEKPSLEVLGGAPSEKAAPIMKQERPPKAETIPVATAEKKTPPPKHIIVQPKAPPEAIQPIMLTLSALKTVATSTPVPEYPYHAKQAGITGSGICILIIDSTNGRVTSAKMAQSTGSKLLDKVTTDTFGRWRFKPGTVSQVKVPISYE